MSLFFLSSQIIINEQHLCSHFSCTRSPPQGQQWPSPLWDPCHPHTGWDGGSFPMFAVHCLCQHCWIPTMRLPQWHCSSSISAFKQIIIFSHCSCFRRNKRRFLEGFAAKICVRVHIGDLFIVLLATNSFMFLNYCSVSFSLVVTLSHTFPGLLLIDLLNDGNEMHQALW